MLQPAAVVPERSAAGVGAAAHADTVAAVSDGVRVDQLDIGAAAGGAAEVDLLGSVAQFYVATGDYGVYDCAAVFGGTGECGE